MIIDLYDGGVMGKYEVIYYEKDCSTTINLIDQYLGRPGVWVLVGKKDGNYRCLNVGKSKNVGSEILFDIACWHFLNKKSDGEQYYNQFAEDCGFKCKSDLTQEYLYPVIYEQYKELAFVYMHDKSDKTIEKQLAWATHAKYWRDSKKFQSPRGNYYERNKKDMWGTFQGVETEIYTILKNRPR